MIYFILCFNYFFDIVFSTGVRFVMPVSDSVEPFKLTSTATRVTKVTCVTSAERPLDRRRNCENTRNDTLTANQSNVTCVARCFFVKVKLSSSFCVSKPILVFIKT